MNLQLETQSGFLGFGSGNLAGEAYHLQNMLATQFGLAPYLKNATEEDSAAVSGMTTVKWFAEYSGTPYAVDANGKVLTRAGGGFLWTQARATAGNSIGNGMVVDQTGRLLVARDRYIQKYNGAWDDTWKDLGSSVTAEKGMDTYLDWVVIPHGNKVAVLNTTDDSLNTSAFTFPTGCSCIIAKSSRTGILLGVNFGSRSFVALWDAQATRAIADWIWFDSPLKSICRAGDNEWIVTTARKIVLTNGYVTKDLPTLSDPVLGAVMHSPSAGGTWTDGSKFYLNHTDVSANYGRRRSGTYVLDLDSSLWTFITPSDGSTLSVSMGGIWQDSTGRLFTSHTNGATSLSHVCQISNALPTSAWLITAPFGKGGTKKVAEGVKVELQSNPINQIYGTFSYVISAKVYDFSRPLWTVATQNGLASGLDKINVDGTSGSANNAAVGDEVTILSGSNGGYIRHITAIADQNTSSETWTLDSALPNLTATGTQILVQPFKLASSFTVTSQTAIPKDGFYFDVKDRIKGKQFMVKVVITDLSVAYLAIPSVSFIYNDLGVI